MDLQSRRRGWNISRAKDEMFAHTDIKQAPWYVVNADNKKKCAPQRHPPPAAVDCLRRSHAQTDQAATARKGKYIRPPIQDQNFVPEKYC